jgi:hypothetical protein
VPCETEQTIFVSKLPRSGLKEYNKFDIKECVSPGRFS